MRLSKYRRLGGLAGTFLALSIAFCQHDFHAPVAADPGTTGPTMASGQEAGADHDHQHCELDVAHHHDLRVPPSITLPPLVAAIYSLHHDTTGAGQAAPARLSHIGNANPSLRALDSIRLRT